MCGGPQRQAERFENTVKRVENSHRLHILRQHLPNVCVLSGISLTQANKTARSVKETVLDCQGNLFLTIPFQGSRAFLLKYLLPITHSRLVLWVRLVWHRRCGVQSREEKSTALWKTAERELCRCAAAGFFINSPSVTLRHLPAMLNTVQAPALLGLTILDSRISVLLAKVP